VNDVNELVITDNYIV